MRGGTQNNIPKRTISRRTDNARREQLSPVNRPSVECGTLVVIIVIRIRVVGSSLAAAGNRRQGSGRRTTPTIRFSRPNLADGAISRRFAAGSGSVHMTGVATA